MIDYLFLLVLYSFQNGGMSGLDQWNFVMHPVDAALTCDPKGDFVKKWIPELAKLPERHIHCPWKAPPSVLARAGVVIGQNYPDRVIKDLEAAREGSLKDISEGVLRNASHKTRVRGHNVGSKMLKMYPKLLIKSFGHWTLVNLSA